MRAERFLLVNYANYVDNADIHVRDRRDAAEEVPKLSGSCGGGIGPTGFSIGSPAYRRVHLTTGARALPRYCPIPYIADKVRMTIRPAEIAGVAMMTSFISFLASCS